MPKRTPLYEVHRRLGARLVEFGGWEMPIQYSGILDEHRAVRAAAGLFDISHMGEVFVAGDGAEEFLNKLLTNDLRKLALGQGQYTLLCRPDGGVVDDLFVYRTGPGEFLLIINASRAEVDVAWMKSELEGFGRAAEVRLTDASDRLSAVAVQGPAVAGFIDGVFPGEAAMAGSQAGKPTELKRNRVSVFSWGGTPVWFARTGYTGEDGFEIVMPNGLAEGVWERLMAVGGGHGLKPCGLGARDTLRTEMCFPLYGHELTEQTTPVEAGLEVFVGWEKEAFNGRDALLAQRAEGPGRRLVAFRLMAAGAPPLRERYRVLAEGAGGAEGGVLGETTSGTLSPSLGVGIGMAYVPAAHAAPGTRLEVEVRGRRYAAEVVKKPLYRRPAAVDLPKAV